MPLSKGDLRDAVRTAAVAAPWENAKDLFSLLITQPRCKDVSFWDFLRQYRKEEAELQKTRDEAQEVRDSGRQGYVPSAVDCPGRHWAKPFVAWDDGFAAASATASSLKAPGVSAAASATTTSARAASG
eukprot:CAMPEP_0179083238 /NCGR_PEP_ID=MMETSP0796-20121207/37576_1 /TAXON_ID=73915 /ORGANISM="Pyrodinium bahamense, Strain pbaha01" /LENGTH=128 /DNA_ID=CAMNT_0020780641 /DNA_START=40 /DNA_END=423 /DNA_ORIENTATION=-